MFQNQRYHHHHPHPHRHPHAVRALDPACNRRLQCQGPHINLDEFVGRIRIVRPKPMKICFKTKTTAMWEQQCHKPPIWEWSMPPTKMVIWGWFIVLPTLPYINGDFRPGACNQERPARIGASLCHLEQAWTLDWSDGMIRHVVAMATTGHSYLR